MLRSGAEHLAKIAGLSPERSRSVAASARLSHRSSTRNGSPHHGSDSFVRATATGDDLTALATFSRNDGAISHSVSNVC